MKKIIFTIFILCFTICTTFAKEAKAPIRLIHTKAGAYIYEVDIKRAGHRVKPLVKYSTVDKIYNCGNYELVVNGGFFNMKTGESASYIVIDGVEVENPANDVNFTASLAKDGRLKQVLNRAEFRVLEKKSLVFENKSKIIFDIANHFDDVPEGYEIKHVLQGGPMLLPDMNLQKEGFIKKNKDGKITLEVADVLKRRERTILALKNDKLYIIIYTQRNPKAMNEIRTYLKKKRFKKAMALDGGGSTSINFNGAKPTFASKTQRTVKSFLVIEREGKCQK